MLLLLFHFLGSWRLRRCWLLGCAINIAYCFDHLPHIFIKIIDKSIDFACSIVTLRLVFFFSGLFIVILLILLIFILLFRLVRNGQFFFSYLNRI